jgi:hypothetical protein
MRSAWLGLGLVCAASCNSGTTTGGPAGPHLRFELAAPDPSTSSLTGIPYPNDLFRDASGHVVMTVDQLGFRATARQDVLATVVRSLGEQDGFGVITGAHFPVAGTDTDIIDEATLAPAVTLVDLAGGDPVPVEVHVRPYYSEFYAGPKRGVILAEGHTYAYLIAAGVKTKSGVPLVSDDGFAQMLATDAYAPLRAYLQAKSIKASGLVGATQFTTAHHDATILAARDEMLAMPAPAAVVDRAYGPTELDAWLGTPVDNTAPGGDNPGGIAHAGISRVILGHFPSPSFLSDKPRALGRWELDSTGKPIVKGTADVPFLLVLPASATSYANLPIVVFQHGLGGSRAAVMSVANTFATAGFAVMGIDIPAHGDRQSNPTDATDNFLGTGPPDGLAEPGGFESVIEVFDLQGDLANGVEPLDPDVMVSMAEQSVIDIIAEGRLIRAGDLTAIQQIDPSLAALSFDAAHITYSGESFGSILGSTAVALSPDYDAAVLSVGGGGLLTELIENSPSFWPLFSSYAAGVVGLTAAQINDDPAHTQLPFILLQSLTEGGDPLTYAHHLLKNPLTNAKHVVLLSAYSDETVPNESNEALATAAGLAWVQVGASSPGVRYVDPLPTCNAPCSGNVSVGGAPFTAAFVQVDPASHGMYTTNFGERQYAIGFPPFVPLATPQDFQNPTKQLQSLGLAFAEDWLAGNVPAVVDTFAP